LDETGDPARAVFAVRLLIAPSEPAGDGRSAANPRQGTGPSGSALADGGGGSAPGKLWHSSPASPGR
ncbi:MAG: hypothetical protein JWP61_2031, partial [Friedmanniella sp.]|nr:hypothetical protein [Friedmanniella sp.]